MSRRRKAKASPPPRELRADGGAPATAVVPAPARAGGWQVEPEARLPFPWSRVAGWGAIAAGVVFLLWLLRPVLATISVSFGVAYLLSPFVDALEKRRVPRSASILLLMAVFFGLVVGGASILVPAVEHEVADVVSHVPAYRDRAVAFVDSDARPWLLQHAGYHLPDNVDAFWKENAQKLATAAPDLATHGVDLVRAAVSNVFSVVGFLLSLILFPVFVFYLLKDFPRIRAAFLESIPLRHRAPLERELFEVDRVLSAFVHGQIIVATLLAAVYGIGLSLIGIDLAIVIGAASGAAFVIPYAGYVLGLGAASVMCIAKFGLDAHLIWVVLLFVGAGVLEANVISPKLVGERVGLHPVVMITAVIVGGELFTFLGVLLAVPTMAVVAVFWRAAWARYKRSEFYLARE